MRFTRAEGGNVDQWYYLSNIHIIMMWVCDWELFNSDLCPRWGKRHNYPRQRHVQGFDKARQNAEQLTAVENAL